MGIKVDMMVIVVATSRFRRVMEVGRESWSAEIYDGDGNVGIGGDPCPNCQLRYFLSWFDLQVDLSVVARWKG